MFGAVSPCVRCCSGELQGKGTATVTLVSFEPCTFELWQQVCWDSDEAEARKWERNEKIGGDHRASARERTGRERTAQQDTVSHGTRLSLFSSFRILNPSLYPRERELNRD